MRDGPQDPEPGQKSQDHRSKFHNNTPFSALEKKRTGTPNRRTALALQIAVCTMVSSSGYT